MTGKLLPRLLGTALLLASLSGVSEAKIRSELNWVKPGLNVERNKITIYVDKSIFPLNISEYDGSPFTDQTIINEIIDIYGITRIEKYFVMKDAPKDPSVPDLSRYYEVTFPSAWEPYEIGLAFENSGTVEFAEHIPIKRKYFSPNDPRFNSQWHLNHCGFPAGWEITRGSREIVIGIIDSGMDMPFDDFGEIQIHEDIADNIWINPGEDVDGNGVIDLDDWDGADNDENGYADDFWGWDATRNSNVPNDPWGEEGGNGHGTHVAGIASAATDNHVGISGAAFSASLMIAACYSPQNDSQIANSDRGIEYCARSGANLINMSYGHSGGVSQRERDVINFARNAGVICFAATGNDNHLDRAGDQSRQYPVALPGVIGVAASDNNDRRTDFSNYGDATDLVAPGEGIISTVPHNRYVSYPGTSMASPLACGLGALILSVRPDLDEEGLLQWMQRTATDISELNQNSPGIVYRINADMAINAIFPKYQIVEWSLSEVQGDMDGRCEPGETVTFDFVILNREGYSDAVGATARLTTNDNTVIFQRQEVNLGDFGGGQELFSGGNNGITFSLAQNAQPHYSDFLLEVTDETERVQSLPVRMTLGMPAFLLVDDDDGANYDSLYSRDLDARPITHDRWHVALSGSPTAEVLREYRHVIWETGNARNAITEAEQNTLIDYLNSGGKGLVLSGQFLSEDIGNTQFHQNYLHARQVSDNTNERQIDGVPGHPISDSLSLIMVGGGGAGNSTSPSSLEPINGGDTLFTYRTSGQVAGVFYTGNNYSVVYLGFALEAVSGGGRTSTRVQVLQSILDHFYVLDVPENSAPVAPGSFVLESPYPNPFNPETSIRVKAPLGADYTLKVIDLAGRTVATLHNGRSSGSSVFSWNGVDSPAGLYLVRLDWQGGSIVQKAVLVK